MAEEAKLQGRIIKEIEKRGYIALKFIKTNKNGIPDLQILLGNGKHIWIEVKSEKGRLSEIQKYRIKELEDSGDIVLVIYSYDEFLEKILLLK